MRIDSSSVRGPAAVPAALLALAIVLLSACGQNVTTPSPSPTDASPSATLSDGPTAVPTDPNTSPEPSQPGQSDTDWGRIWDALPGSFPEFAGASPAETGEGPASAVLDVGDTDPAEVAAYYVGALEAAGYSTLARSDPREDGSIEAEWAGDTTCRVRATITPLGGTTIVTILYGADCPFE
ncbi:MAG TPA: hypothetical protein VFV53_04580 [Candidatus Limnocylindrales bacterium]|nr:hypothetical protein [Candidatus Limnocylindrales bacterium]